MHIIQIATLATAAITIVGAALIVPAAEPPTRDHLYAIAIPIWRAPAYIAAGYTVYFIARAPPLNGISAAI